jgi:hypothetical protein
MMEYFAKYVTVCSCTATATTIVITDPRIGTTDVCLYSAMSTAAAIQVAGATAASSMFVTVSTGKVTFHSSGVDWGGTEVFSVVVLPRAVDAPGTSHPGA